MKSLQKLALIFYDLPTHHPPRLCPWEFADALRMKIMRCPPFDDEEILKGILEEGLKHLNRHSMGFSWSSQENVLMQ